MLSLKPHVRRFLINDRSAPPIIVMSFNRPRYLARVLESLKAQTPSLDDSRIHLFQDGAINAYSGVEYASLQEISECIAIFCKIFPKGHVHLSKQNIGICENFLRAERFAFLTLNAPVAYFFEDDLVLEPRYVSTLDVLKRSFGSEHRIGYFNAFGKYKAPLATQEENRNTIVKMGHMWGFALRQSHWKNMQRFLVPYHKLVCGRDYRKRPHAEILALFEGWGVFKKETSQDSAKDIATNFLRCCRVSTYFCLAKYIGEKGFHSTAEIFAAMGFADTQVYQKQIPSSFVFTPAEIDAQVDFIEEAWREENQV